MDGPLTNDIITYDYDELGRLIGRAVNSIGLTLAYDALGRLTEEINPLGTFGYSHVGATSRVDTAVYPNGQTTSYSYFGNSGDRRLQTIHHKKSDASTLSKFDYTYDAIGNIQTWTQQADSAAPTVQQFRYDAADQLTGATRQTADTTPAVLKRFSYGYDPAGNRTGEQIDDAIGGTSHDSLNRLTSQTVGGALRIVGTLNEAGNVTVQGKPATVDATNRFESTVPVTTGTTIVDVTATDGSGNQTTSTYEVDQSGTGAVLTYDANGNLTSDGTRTFMWDAANRLLAVTVGAKTSEFTYNGANRRVRALEKDSGVTTRDAQLIWDGLEIAEERLSAGELNRFFTDGEQHDGAARYLTRDHIRSVREVTDGAGTLVTRNDYDPYGRLTRVAGSEDSRLGFTGHHVHGPSGLSMTLYRAYDPTLGRWLSEDPLNEDSPTLYAYARNNPLSFIDLDGRQATVWPGIVIGEIVAGPPGAVIGGIIGGGLGLAFGWWLTSDTTLPFIGPPGSTAQTDKQSRKYGTDGYPDTDVDTGHDHNGAGDPHSHDWGRPPDGGPPTRTDRSTARPWKPGDPPPPKQCVK